MVLGRDIMGFMAQRPCETRIFHCKHLSDQNVLRVNKKHGRFNLQDGLKMIKQLAASRTSKSYGSPIQLLTVNTHAPLIPEPVEAADPVESMEWVFDDAENPVDDDPAGIDQDGQDDLTIGEIVKTIQGMLERRIDQLDISHSEDDITVSGIVTSYHERQLAEQGAKLVACQCEQRRFVSEICVVKDGASAAHHVTR